MDINSPREQVGLHTNRTLPPQATNVVVGSGKHQKMRMIPDGTDVPT